MRSKLSDFKSLYTTLGGESTDVLSANSEIAVINGILALGNVDSSQFIPDAIKAIADNFNSIDPSPAADLMEKTATIPLPDFNATLNAVSDEVDGYSVVRLTGPSQQEIAANWYPVTLTADATTKVITISNTFEADVTAAYQAGKTLYLKVVEEI